MKQIQKENFVVKTTVVIFFLILMNLIHLVAKTNAVKRHVETDTLIKLEKNVMVNLNVMKAVKLNSQVTLVLTRTDATLPVGMDLKQLMKFVIHLISWETLF